MSRESRIKRQAKQIAEANQLAAIRYANLQAAEIVAPRPDLAAPQTNEAQACTEVRELLQAGQRVQISKEPVFVFANGQPGHGLYRVDQRAATKTDQSVLSSELIWHTSRHNIRRAVKHGMIAPPSLTGQVISKLGQYRFEMTERLYHYHSQTPASERKVLVLDYIQSLIEALQPVERLTGEDPDLGAVIDAAQRAITELTIDERLLEENQFPELREYIVRVRNDLICKLTSLQQSENHNRRPEHFKLEHADVMRLMMLDVLNAAGDMNQVVSHRVRGQTRGQFKSVCEEARRIVDQYTFDLHNPVTEEHQTLTRHDKEEDIICLPLATLGNGDRKLEQSLMTICQLEGADQAEKQPGKGWQLSCGFASLTSEGGERKAIPLRTSISNWRRFKKHGSKIIKNLKAPFVSGSGEIRELGLLLEDRENSTYAQVLKAIQLKQPAIFWPLVRSIPGTIYRYSFGAIVNFGRALISEVVDDFRGMAYDWRAASSDQAQEESFQGLMAEIASLKEQAQEQLVKEQADSKDNAPVKLQNPTQDGESPGQVLLGLAAQAEQGPQSRAGREEGEQAPQGEAARAQPASTATTGLPLAAPLPVAHVPYSLQTGIATDDLLNFSTIQLNNFLDDLTYELQNKYPAIGLLFNTSMILTGLTALHMPMNGVLEKTISMLKISAQHEYLSVFDTAYSLSFTIREALAVCTRADCSVMLRVASYCEDNPYKAILLLTVIAGTAGSAVSLGHESLRQMIDWVNHADDMIPAFFAADKTLSVLIQLKLRAMIYSFKTGRYDAKVGQEQHQIEVERVQREIDALLRQVHANEQSPQGHSSFDTSVLQKIRLVLLLQEHSPYLHCLHYDEKRLILSYAERLFPGAPALYRDLQQMLFPKPKLNFISTTLLIPLTYPTKLLRLFSYGLIRGLQWCGLSKRAGNRANFFTDKVIADSARLYHAVSRTIDSVAHYIKASIRSVYDVLVNQLLLAVFPSLALPMTGFANACDRGYERIRATVNRFGRSIRRRITTASLEALDFTANFSEEQRVTASELPPAAGSTTDTSDTYNRLMGSIHRNGVLNSFVRFDDEMDDVSRAAVAEMEGTEGLDAAAADAVFLEAPGSQESAPQASNEAQADLGQAANPAAPASLAADLEHLAPSEPEAFVQPGGETASPQAPPEEQPGTPEQAASPQTATPPQATTPLASVEAPQQPPVAVAGGPTVWEEEQRRRQAQEAANRAVEAEAEYQRRLMERLEALPGTRPGEDGPPAESFVVLRPDPPKQ